MLEMKKLELPDTQRLQAAYGFIGEGKLAAARAELDALTPEARNHPGVLTAQLSLAERARDWDVCVVLAGDLIEALPDNPIYWVQRSQYLRDLGRIQEAWDRLLPAAEKFPVFWMIPYNLACYACRLGNVDEARNRLNAALQLVDADAIKTKAMAEPDLESSWPEIRGL
jgi:predicted Zn-dependent protease